MRRAKVRAESHDLSGHGTELGIARRLLSWLVCENAGVVLDLVSEASDELFNPLCIGDATCGGTKHGAPTSSVEGALLLYLL